MAAYYRKWRPQTFDDVCGQDHVKKTLINALKTRKVAHAYLFAGPRGTGKTTMARLLAKSLNCEKVNYKDGENKAVEPCNKCASCQEIMQGQSFDVIEIDAASNRGIEEIRELREKVKFAPVRSPFKVFIIDEVHMLTREAFNALLKTLEEPPAHVIFILATTEVHKILPTIVSRCQRYDFRRGELPQIESKLKQVAKDEKLKMDEEAVRLIARMADGSFRDGLSLLDQIASVAGGEKVTVATVRQALGLADQESVGQFLDNLSQGKVDELIKVVRAVGESGGDMTVFVNQILEKVRAILFIKSGVTREVIAQDWTDEEWVSWAKIGRQFGIDELIVLLNELIACLGEIKKAPVAALPVEVLAIGWLQRFNKIKEVGKPVTIVIDEPVKAADPVKMQDIVKVSEEAPAVKVDAVGTAVDEVKVEVSDSDDQKVWLSVIEKVRPENHSLYSFLKDAYVKTMDGEKIVLGVRFRFHSERIYDRKNKQLIENAIESVCGKSLRVECLIDEKLPKPKSVADQDMMATAVEVFGMEE